LGSEHEADVEDPYAEEWSPTFSMVDETASVGKGALVHDSVVMRNARIGAGAVLVRSLVCEGAAVEAGRVVFDSVVGRSSSSGKAEGGSR
jgi:ADP-glucose pyrophosphorylase